MKPSIKTISEMAGVSQATVSNALNNKKGVNKETAEKVFQIAREIGYLTEHRITSIRLVIYKDTGAVVNDSPFFSSLLSGVESEVRNFGLDTVFHYLSRNELEYESRFSELLNDPSCALLVLATELDTAEAARFQGAMGPVVFLDNWYEELSFNAVLIDNTDAVSAAVLYLLEMGHREIGYLRSSFPIKNFYYRSAGFQRALDENQIPFSKEFSFSLSPSMEGACWDMGRILEKTNKMPTAFFADNDMIALGAIRALQQQGYRIPEDISVVGFDDLPFCAISNPPLTTVKVHNHQMGCVAVRRLMELINYGDSFQTKIQVRSAFVERDSVKRIGPSQRSFQLPHAKSAPDN